MTAHDLYTLYSESANYADEDAFVSDWATSSVFDPAPDLAAPDYDAIISDLRAIWRATHRSIKELRAVAGDSQAQFAERFCLSRRTVEDWETRSKCPLHIRIMMSQILGLAPKAD